LDLDYVIGRPAKQPNAAATQRIAQALRYLDPVLKQYKGSIKFAV